MDHVPHLLLVGPRSEVLGKLYGMPVALTVVRRPGGKLAVEEGLALRVIDVDFTDTAAFVAAAREIYAWRPIDAVLGLTELSLYPTSVVGESLGVRGNPPTAVACAMDKATMRQRLAAAGLDTTAHQLCMSLDDAKAFARRCPTGMILKPVNGNGGTGVYLVREPADLEAGWEWSTTAAGGWSVSGANGRLVLAEEYLTGEEFSVETMSAGGEHRVLAVTGKHTTGPPYFVEVGHDLPAMVSPTQYTAITQIVLNALTAIGYQWGPCHTEVMLRNGEDRAAIVEINARFGGDQIWELVQLATGVDVFTGSVAALAFGELPAVEAGVGGGAAIRFPTAEPGRVVAVTGVDDALALDGVIRVADLCEVGAVVSPLGSSWNRIGYVLAAGADPKRAATAADLATSRIMIRTVADE
jgi:biotin carboxylase